MPSVTILLASYNGERYIDEQLASVVAQTHSEWELWVRDDGSGDRTVDIVRRLAARDARVHLLESDSRRLGSTGNFGALIDWAASPTRTEYVMLCDQDDVWRPDKIRITLDGMQRAETESGADTPILVHTDFDFVDERLRILGTLAPVAKVLSSPEHRILNRLLSQNFMYGCTMMLNRALVEACAPIPKTAEQHDYWVALVAAAVGRIVHIPQRTVLYRQHASNETPGLNAASISRRLKRLLFGWSATGQVNRRRYLQAETLAQHLAERLPDSARRLLDDYLSSMARGRVAAVRFACRNGLRRQGTLQTARYLLSLLASGPAPDGRRLAHARSIGR